MKLTLSHPLQLIQGRNALDERVFHCAIFPLIGSTDLDPHRTTNEFYPTFWRPFVPGAQMRFLRVDYSRVALDDMRAQVCKHSKHTRTDRQRTAEVVRDAFLQLNISNMLSNHMQQSLWITICEGGSSKSFTQEQKGVRVEEEEKKGKCFWNENQYWLNCSFWIVKGPTV